MQKGMKKRNWRCWADNSEHQPADEVKPLPAKYTEGHRCMTNKEQECRGGQHKKRNTTACNAKHMSEPSEYRVHECPEINQICKAVTSSSSLIHYELPMIDITCERQQQPDNNHKCIEPSSQTAQTKQKRATKGKKACTDRCNTMPAHLKRRMRYP